MPTGSAYTRCIGAHIIDRSHPIPGATGYGNPESNTPNVAGTLTIPYSRAYTNANCDTQPPSITDSSSAPTGH